MHVSKILLTLGAVLLALPSLNAQRPDTDAQARAREALRQKMSEGSVAPAEPPPAARPAQPPPAAPVVRPAVTDAPVRVVTPLPAPAARSTSANDEKLREALRQKLNEAEQQPAPPAQPTPAPPTQVTESWPTAVPGSAIPAGSETDARLREALRKELAEVAPTPAPVVTPPAAVKPAPNIELPGVSTSPGVAQAMNPPAPAVSTDKEQRLAGLLNQYKSNVLSAEEYHKKRAEILAER